MLRNLPILAIAVVTIGADCGTALAASAPGVTTRVSVASDGTPSNGFFDRHVAISANGRFVAFASEANNLVDGDTNGKEDVFVHDRKTGATTRVSVASNGAQGSDVSSIPALSADGRFVAFQSDSPNLVSGDTNGMEDVFVHDRTTGVTTRVSVASSGVQGNNHSARGRISANGQFVAFWSQADNLVAGDTNGAPDIFVHDRTTGTTERVSVSSDGAEVTGDSYTPAISADGRFVAFESQSAQLVNGDTNGKNDIFVHDRTTGATARVSVAADGTESEDHAFTPAISADGRFVAFESTSPNLVDGDRNGASDIFVHDRRSATTTRVSLASDGTEGSGSSEEAAISADGRFVVFESEAANLVDRDTNHSSDVFVRDRTTGITTRVSIGSDGTQGSRSSSSPAISADGRVVAFQSDGRNFATGDIELSFQVFVRELAGSGNAPETTPVAPPRAGRAAAAPE